MFIKNIDWNDVLARVFKTFLQSFASMITVGVVASEVNWMNALSVALVASVYSLAMNIVKYLPEDEADYDAY